jgi:hypothetical protein
MSLHLGTAEPAVNNCPIDRFVRKVIRDTDSCHAIQAGAQTCAGYAQLHECTVYMPHSHTLRENPQRGA